MRPDVNWKKISPLLFSIIAIFLFFSFFYKGELIISINNSIKEIQINDKVHKIDKTLILKKRPGKLTITVHNEDFEKYEKEVKIHFNKKTNVPINLTAEPVRLLNNISLPKASNDERYIYFADSNKKVLSRLDIETKKEENLSPSFSQIINNIYWSPNNNQAIVFLGKNKNGRFKANLFDLKSQKFLPLNEGIKNPIAWSPNGDLFTYPFFKVDGSFDLNIAKPDGKDWRKITDILGLERVYWPKEKEILLIPHNGDDFENSFTIDPDGNKNDLGKFIDDFRLIDNNRYLFRKITETESVSLDITDESFKKLHTINLNIKLEDSFINNSKIYYITEEGDKQFITILNLDTNKEERKIALPQTPDLHNLIIIKNKAYFTSNNALYSYIID